jgi:hypothetical protein
VERQRPEIVAALHQDIEGAELDFVVMLARVQRVVTKGTLVPKISSNEPSRRMLDDYHRTARWHLSVMRTPIALPPNPNRE